MHATLKKRKRKEGGGPIFKRYPSIGNDRFNPGSVPILRERPAGRLGRGLISHRSCLPHLEATAPIRSNPLGLNQRPGPTPRGGPLSLSLFPGVSPVREKRRVKKKTLSLEALENGVEEGPGQQTTTTPAPEPEQQQLQQHRLRRRGVAPPLISGNPSSLRARALRRFAVAAPPPSIRARMEWRRKRVRREIRSDEL